MQTHYHTAIHTTAEQERVTAQINKHTDYEQMIVVIITKTDCNFIEIMVLLTLDDDHLGRNM
jgi:hypothetical protein